MILINLSILCLMIYECIYLIKNNLKKELFVYLFMFSLVIATEIFSIGKISLSSTLLKMLHI
jgi:hypothetical protein